MPATNPHVHPGSLVSHVEFIKQGLRSVLCPLSSRWRLPGTSSTVQMPRNICSFILPELTVPPRGDWSSQASCAACPAGLSHAAQVSSGPFKEGAKGTRVSKGIKNKDEGVGNGKDFKHQVS